MYTTTQQLPRKPNFEEGDFPISPVQWQQDKCSPSLSGSSHRTYVDTHQRAAHLQRLAQQRLQHELTSRLNLILYCWHLFREQHREVLTSLPSLFSDSLTCAYLYCVDAITEPIKTPTRAAYLSFSCSTAVLSHVLASTVQLNTAEILYRLIHLHRLCSRPGCL